MTMILLGILTVLLCFGLVVLFGAPYLPTLTPQVRTALQLADMQPGDRLLELGCGDGKVLIAAAKQGISSVGYELNPIMAFIAWLRTRRYGDKIKIVWGDLWRADWPETEVMFVFLLPKFMPKLDTKIVQYKHKPVKLVSFAFPIPGRHVTAQKDGVYLYKYN
jgi:SAM-dependent methyltransferase